MIDKPWGEDGLMAIAAVRYCIGRMTYIVADCVSWCISTWDEFPPNVQFLIARDLGEAIERDDKDRADGLQYKTLGHDCDRREWDRLNAFIVRKQTEGKNDAD